MTGLRDRFEEMAAETLVYGDLDSAIHRVAQRRRRRTVLSVGAAVTAAVLLFAGAQAIDRNGPTSLQPLGPSATTDPTAFRGNLLDGIVTPGRYRFAVRNTCEEHPACKAKPPQGLPTIEVTVPEGWDAATEFVSLFPMPGRDTTSRNDPALAMGWTSHWVALFSQPCHAENAGPADIAVGPTVDDFVDAVTGRPGLDVTEPKPVRLGRHSGRFFTLNGPSDISGCGEWRPWDPAPYLQGPSNIWDVWVMNVDGVRVVIMTEYFPETPATIKAELRAMAESVHFLPSST